MSASGSAAGLAQALKELTLHWQETKAHWRDVKAQQFEKDYLEELPHLVARGSNAIEELEALLRKVRTDCE